LRVACEHGEPHQVLRDQPVVVRDRVIDGGMRATICWSLAAT